jgi:serine/threonine protein phosphatase PrpC
LTEEEFINAARTGYKYGILMLNIGFGRFSRAGSCVLVCLVHNNKVYTANAGDSLGILIEEGNNFIYERSRHDEIHLDK